MYGQKVEHLYNMVDDITKNNTFKQAKLNAILCIVCGLLQGPI